MFKKMLEKAQQKIAEWERYPQLSAPYKARVFMLESEIEQLKECRCGKSVHSQYESRRKASNV